MIFEVNLYKFPDNKLFISVNDSMIKVKYFLEDFYFRGKEIENEEIEKYVNDKTPNVNARTTLFKGTGLIFIKLNNYSNKIRSIAILVHELTHASKRLVDEEEAEAYLTEYLFEESMKILKPNINYKHEGRNWKWLEQMTRNY